MAPSALDIQALDKSFAGHRALRDVTLSVRPGEFLSILGPSGCGKSTLLRLVAGLDQPDGGDIRIAGRTMRGVGPRDRGVAFVFQTYALYPHLSCRGNIAAPLVMRELNAFERLPLLHRALPAIARKRRAIDARVRAIAQLLQVEPWLDRKPAQLSGGQRQRVALGRALVREPSLFLLDEPFANLDAALRHQTRAELAALQRRLGTTTIFVTHDQAEAMALSDRIAVMFDGAIRQLATPDALYRSPVDLDVARFLSQPELNCLPAKVIAPGHVSIGGEHVALRAAATPGADGTLAFRPEHATLLARPTQGALRATVLRCEHAGPDVHVFLRLASGAADCVVRASSDELARWRPGAACAIAPDARAAWFFPQAAQPAQACVAA